MLINPYSDPVKFIASFGKLDPEKIIALLAERKIIVSPEIAKLIQEKAA